MTQALMFSGVDTGGQGYQLARALRGIGWDATAVRRRDSWFQYPSDLTWTRSVTVKIRRIAATADVIHLSQGPGLVKHLGRVTGRVVVQHHGTYFRQAPRAVSRACRSIGAIEVAVDYGLLALAPGAQLLPVIVDLELMASLRGEHYVPDDRVRIFHSPTNRAFKQTDALIAAVGRLAARYPLDLQIVERVPWAECLARKATADIVFDQAELGYGINAVEAMGMGIPVVAGIADTRARSMMIDAWGSLPFVEATADTIESALGPLVADAQYRHVVGQLGRQHAEKIHAPPAVAARYEALLA